MSPTAIIALSVLGFLAAALVLTALLDATRGTPVETVRTPGAEDQPPPAVSDPVFRTTIQLLTGTMLEPGHAIEILRNGAETYPRLWADLAGAQRTIAIQMYYCNPGHVADRLREILSERARSGVCVFLLYDWFGSTLDREYFDSLRTAGVEVAAFRPLRWHALHTVLHRSHARIVAIDGQIGYTGGFGIDDKWLGDGRQEGHWRDTNARVQGPAALQLQAAFGESWAEAKGELLTGALCFPVQDGREEGRALAGVLHATPSVGSTAAERFFALSITGARHRLWITNSYFVPDDDFRRFLKEAVSRGADVRILTAGETTDVKTTWYGGRARYEELLAAGVRIYEYQPVMMHAKTMTVDGVWCTVGSMNTDNRSMAFNDEVNLIVLDADVAATLEKTFLEDLAYATEIRLDTFRRRPWYHRPLELGAHALSRIL